MSEIYSEPLGDEVLRVVRVTPDLVQKTLQAKKRISTESWRNYVGDTTVFSKFQKDVGRPPRGPKEKGTVWFALVIDETIVGMAHHHYYTSIWTENLICDGGLVVLDKHQRRGVATAYSKISVRVAKANGCAAFVGETRKDSPMHKIRARDGWRVTKTLTRKGETWVRLKYIL